MSQPNLGAMRAVADRLDNLGLDYAFLGGSIVNLLLDDPALSPARPTDDVDVILAGDIFYEQPLAERACAWLRRLVRERGVVALVADAGRVYSPSGGLAPLMSYVVPTSRELEDGETRTAVVSRVLA